MKRFLRKLAKFKKAIDWDKVATWLAIAYYLLALLDRLLSFF